MEFLLTDEAPLLSVGGVSRYLKSLLAGDPYLVRLWVSGTGLGKPMGTSRGEP
ncbi:hypothetical protein ACVWZF_000184 [Thermostichus sp. OS-CIW-30]